MTKEIVIAGWPIDAETTLKKRVEHKGVQIDVSNHGRNEVGCGRGTEGTYCYYLIISERQVSEEAFKEFWLEPKINESSSGFDRVSYNYTSAPFADAHWHGGVTFYDKLGGIDGNQRLVKIGCDFAHYWDQRHTFDLDSVIDEAKITVDQLAKMYEFYVRCNWNGSYHPAAEMIEEKGRLYSAKGHASWKESCAKSAAAEPA